MRKFIAKHKLLVTLFLVASFGAMLMAADTKISALPALLQSAITTSDQLPIVNSSTTKSITISELNKQWAPLTGNSVIFQNATTNGSTTVDIKGNGTSPLQKLRVYNYNGSTQAQSAILGSQSGFDQLAANGGISTSAAGDFTISGNASIGGFLQFGGTIASGGGSQSISGTCSTAVVDSVVICSGTTTVPVLPAPTTYSVVIIKNMGSGNCTVTQHSSEAIVPLASTSTGSGILVLSSGAQGTFVTDGTNWYRIN